MVCGTVYKWSALPGILTKSVLYLESRRTDRGIVKYRKRDIDSTILFPREADVLMVHRKCTDGLREECGGECMGCIRGYSFEMLKTVTFTH